MSLFNHNKKPYKGIVPISVAVVLAASMVGCNTMQPIKPTASVMVGAHKSL